MSNSPDPLDPATSPDTIGKPSGVRRVNNVPMYILGGVIGAFLLVMALVASQRAAQQNIPGEDKQEKHTSSATFAKEIAGDKKSGMVEAARPLVVPTLPNDAPPAPGTVLVARPENLDAPPLPPSGAAVSRANPSTDSEAEKIRTAKLQMLEEAIRAKTNVRVSAPRSSGSSSTNATSGTPQTREEVLARLTEVRQQIDAGQRDDPTGAYQARLSQIRAMQGSGSGPSSSGSSSAPGLLQGASSSGAGGNSYAQFAGNGGDRWKLDAKPEAPGSAYELRAGFVVPATLISGINSDLPGQIMAQVSQDVLDTPTGNHLLIPQGSRLVGSYSSEVAYGQSRVLIAWQRIVFPDGKAMDIGSMPGADSAGYAGFKDQVNNHYVRLFASAFLMSGVTAGITYSQRDKQASPFSAQTASSALNEALGQQLGQVTAQLINKNMNIAPTLEIRPGYRFNVIVTKDMTFSKPYRSFDY